MLVAFSGLAGTGKTTAIDILASNGYGSGIYVGGFVTAEVDRRGMPIGSRSEKLVRESLREEGGMDALARLAVPQIESILNAGGTAFVDAIYNQEERILYESVFEKQLVCIALETALAERIVRLGKRPDRPLDPPEIEVRDDFELTQLGLGEVIKTSNHLIANNASLEDLKKALVAVANVSFPSLP